MVFFDFFAITNIGKQYIYISRGGSRSWEMRLEYNRPQIYILQLYSQIYGCLPDLSANNPDCSSATGRDFFICARRYTILYSSL